MRPLLSLIAPIVATATLLAAQVLAGEARLAERFAPLSLPWQHLILAWITVCTALLAAAGWRVATGSSWGNAVRLRRAHPMALLCGVFAGGALWVLAQWLVAAQRGCIPPALLDRWDTETFEHAQTAFALLGWSTPLALASSLLAGAFAPAFAEELMYRGLVVESGAQSDVPATATAIASAALFAAIHFSLPLLLPMAALGIGLALLSLRSGSVLPAVVAHATFNTITIVLLPSTKTMVPVNSLPLLLLAIAACAGFAVLLRLVGRYGNGTAPQVP